MKRSSTIAFIVACLVLGTSAVALETATRFLRLHFRKERVELRQPIESISSTCGPWVQVSLDQPLPEDLEHTLGTSQYVFRDYLDSRVVAPDFIARFKDQSFEQRKALFLEYQKQNASAAITLAVTYYTGLVDTVAHVPDRCYVADGYDVSHADVLHWSAGGRGMDVRFLTFGDTTNVGRVNRNVAYLFQANGKYVCDPIDVRIILQDLRAKYGYYAKVELMTTIANPADAAKVMDDFLGNAIGCIEPVLPDWSQYSNR